MKKLSILFTMLLACCLYPSCNNGDTGQSVDHDYIMVCTGVSHSCALHSDGSVDCWGCEGDFNFGQCDVPDGSYVYLACGLAHTCLIDEDGYVICFGCEGNTYGIPNDKGQCDPPGHVQFDSISTSWVRSSGITSHDTVIDWVE
jgi:alpha-tubulin suppressor-like RCC1 family protein